MITLFKGVIRLLAGIGDDGQGAVDAFNPGLDVRQ
jgi:hypothetical protein